MRDASDIDPQGARPLGHACSAVSCASGRLHDWRGLFNPQPFELPLVVKDQDQMRLANHDLGLSSTRRTKSWSIWQAASAACATSMAPQLSTHSMWNYSLSRGLRAAPWVWHRCVKSSAALSGHCAAPERAEGNL